MRLGGLEGGRGFWEEGRDSLIIPASVSEGCPY